jgi:putative ABC transport system substrate-binding protein
LGWADGRNVRIDLRWGGSDINRIRALAQELVRLQPDIILTSATPATVALQRETRTIPIVFTTLADPVASGIVERLDRPGGQPKRTVADSLDDAKAAFRAAWGRQYPLSQG